MVSAVSRTTALKILLVFLVVVALSVPVLYSYFVYTPTVNVQCGICHTMQFYVTNISEPHAKYSCLVCHEITVGGIGDMMWTYVAERPAPSAVFEKYYPRKNLLDQCERCHTDTQKLAIHQTHLSVVKTLGTCSACHTIHMQNFLSQSCTKCHPYLDTVEKHMKMHSAAALQLSLQQCSKCHSPQQTCASRQWWRGRVVPPLSLGCRPPPLRGSERLAIFSSASRWELYGCRVYSPTLDSPWL
jgi:Zn finger protein HypA/HybF involved in hydrogenase expression